MTVTYTTEKDWQAAQAVGLLPTYRSQTLTPTQARVWPKLAEQLGVVAYVIEHG